MISKVVLEIVLVVVPADVPVMASASIIEILVQIIENLVLFLMIVQYIRSFLSFKFFNTDIVVYV